MTRAHLNRFTNKILDIPRESHNRKSVVHTCSHLSLLRNVTIEFCAMGEKGAPIPGRVSEQAHGRN